MGIKKVLPSLCWIIIDRDKITHNGEVGKFRAPSPPTHRLCEATNAGQMQDTDSHRGGTSEFRKEKGRHRCQASCFEIVQGTFRKSVGYLTNCNFLRAYNVP